MLSTSGVRRLFGSLLTAGCAAVSYRCADPGAVDPTGTDSLTVPVAGLVISNPQSISNPEVVGKASIARATEGGIVYVSLAPKSLPDARKVEISNRNLRSSPILVVSVVDGGLDPVAIQANAGDTLNLTTSVSDGRTEVMAVKVPAKRPPSVVRSNPSKGRTDVALNIIVEVVFSEPLNASTVTTSSIQLRQGGRVVSGTVSLRGDAWEAAFAPRALLDPATPYEIVVTRDIRDLDGDALETEFSSTFVTGSDSCGADQPGCQVPRSDEAVVISGTVLDRTGSQEHPVANASVSALVQPIAGASYLLPLTWSDNSGRYTLTAEPNATVLLHAAAEGFDQRCGVTVEPGTRSGNSDIAMVASGSLACVGALPRLTGRIYLGPQQIPVAGARVSLESTQSFETVTASTDGAGAFSLCSLPTFGAQTFVVSKEGYTTVRIPLALGASEEWGVYIDLSYEAIP
jgi:hypothetical protein